FDYTVVTLTENGNTWMTDNPFEVESSLGAIEGARGDVLIGGLGIGLLPTLMKDKVDSIDIVELNQEVIDLVFHQVATEKTQIIHDDICHYLTSTGKRYDFICVDIWSDTFLPMWDIDAVKTLARRCLKPSGDIWCWLEELYHGGDDKG
ncbi:MAG: class I SAM-dependent methyltransferase, partial [Dehalococcoidales bacterium]|nr:class I SAM-dependent methyltransferase [Dehalococcoidales bacterium]